MGLARFFSCKGSHTESVDTRELEDAIKKYQIAIQFLDVKLSRWDNFKLKLNSLWVRIIY
jgi:hypothetical protein